MASPIAPERPLDRLRQRLDSLRGTLQPEAAGPDVAPENPQPDLGRLQARLQQLRLVRHANIRALVTPMFRGTRGEVEPANEAARDVLRARGPAAPELTTGERAKQFGTSLGESAAVTAALAATGAPGILAGALEAVNVPGSPLEQRFPTSRGAPPVAGYGGERYAVSGAAAAPAPGPGDIATISLARELLARDPKALGGLAGMVLGGAVGGEMLRSRPGRGVTRPTGRVNRPGAPDPFVELGLNPRTATADEVNAAFRREALRTHPDLAPDVRASRGGPTDPLQASLEFLRAQAARDAALEQLGAKPVQERAPEPTAQPAPTPKPAPAPTQAAPQPAPAAPEAPAPVPRPPEPIVAPAAPQPRAPTSRQIPPIAGEEQRLQRTPPPEESFAAAQARKSPPPMPAFEEFIRPAGPPSPRPAPTPAQVEAVGPEGVPVASLGRMAPDLEAADRAVRQAAVGGKPKVTLRQTGANTWELETRAPNGEVSSQTGKRTDLEAKARAEVGQGYDIELLPPADRQANVDRFIAAWEPKLRAAIAANPAEYGHPDENDIQGTLNKFRRTLVEKGAKAVNLSASLKAAARALGLKPTQRAIEEYFGRPAAKAPVTPQVPNVPGQKYVLPSFATGTPPGPQAAARVREAERGMAAERLAASMAKGTFLGLPDGATFEFDDVPDVLYRKEGRFYRQIAGGKRLTANPESAVTPRAPTPGEETLMVKAGMAPPAAPPKPQRTLEQARAERTAAEEAAREEAAAGNFAAIRHDEEVGEPEKPYASSARDYFERIDAALSAGRVADARALYTELQQNHPDIEQRIAAAEHEQRQQLEIPTAAPTPAPAAEAPPAAAPVVQRTLEEAGRPASQADLEALVQHAYMALQSVEGVATLPRDAKGVRRWAEQVLGRPYSSGTWTTDDVFDAIEVAANLQAEAMLGSVPWNGERQITEDLKAAREIEEKIFGTRTRTEAMVARQQFSTPLPIARAAAYMTDVLPGEKVLEPTAGTGNLINPLRGSGVTIDANELDPRRAALLRILDPALHITSEDALALQLSGKRYNAVVMNPPFGSYSTGKYTGKGATDFAASDISQRFVAAALKSLVPGGRLVAVMPEGMMGKNATPFRQWLAKNYRVRLVLESPAGSYATRGTTFGSWTLVVDNEPPKQVGFPSIPKPSWDNWYRAVAALGRPEPGMRAGGHAPAEDVAPTPRPGAPAPVAPAPAPLVTPAPLAPEPVTTAPSPVAQAAQEMADAVKQAVKDAVEEVRRERPERAEPTPRAAAARPLGAGTAPEPVGGVGGERGVEPGGPAPEPGGGAVPPTAGRAGVVAPEAPAEPRAAEAGAAPPVVPRLARRRVEPGRLDSPERRAEIQAANDSPVFAPYERGTTEQRNPHPRLVVETRSQAGMPPPALSVTKFQSAALEAARARPGEKGGVSDDQADMAMRVMSAWDRGHGFVVADDVGVGKTREAAAVILEAIARGKERIVYSTFNAVNVGDVIKELRLVATGDEEGEFPATFVLGSDYPKAATRGPKVRTAGLPQPPGPVVYLVHSTNFAALSESLLEVQPQVWVADEAHQYKNAFAARGIAWQKLHGHMLERGGQFVYFTATPGVTLDELGYLYGIKEWQPGGFGDWVRRRLGKADEETGEGAERTADAQRVQDRAEGERAGIETAGDLVPGKKRPFFREKVDAFSGRISPAETEQVMRELKGLGKFLARDLWRGGVEFKVETVDLLGDTPKAQAARERYDQAAELAREITTAARKYGYMNKQVKGTGLERAMIQSYMKQVLFDLRLPDILAQADASLAAGRQVVISVHTVTGDVDLEEGLTEETAQVPLNKRMESAINRINTREVEKQGEGDNVEYVDLGEIPEALAKRAELLDRLRALPPLKDPVRVLEEHFGAKKLAVITGQVTPVNRAKQMAEFQSGKRPVAIISRAGKTGISLHDVNGKQRHLIVGDYEWSADTFKQELGRVDRAGQKSKPKITLVASNIAGERKFASTIAARMATLGATSKGAAEATGTDALDQFEATGDIPVAAMKNAIEQLPDALRRYFTGSKFVEAKQARGGQGLVFEPKRRPDDADMRGFLLEMLMFPVEASNQVFAQWVLEREKLMTGEAVAAAEARRTGKLTGHVVRVTDLAKDPQPPITMFEVKNDAGEERAIVQGFVTQHIQAIQDARGRDESGFQRPRRYVQFTDTQTGELIAGLEVAPAEARRIKTLFGAGTQRFLTPADAFSDLQAGDNVPIEGPEGIEWELHPRRDQRVQIRGATVSKHRDVLRGYAAYEPVGNFLYVKEGDTAEGIARFLERFPVRQQVPKAPAAPVPPEPSAARYERLGRILRSPLPLRTRTLLQDRLIEAGHDQAEVEQLDDRALANRAFESQVLSAEEESRLLDGILGEGGFVRLSARGRARAAAPPEIPPPSVGDALKRAFGPAGRSGGAAEMAHIIRAERGQMDRRNEMALEALARVRQGFPKLDTAAGVEFADRMETGRPVAPELEAAARTIRALLDNARGQVQALGTGALEHFITNYLPHIWERPADAVGILQRILGKRPLQGPKSFLKQRTIPTIAEGIEAGLVPVTKDLLDMVALKLREMNRYVHGQRIMQQAREQGLVKFVRAGRQAPNGYRRIDDAIATVYGPRTEQGAMTIRGQYYAPEPIATVLNNYLSPGLRGNPLFDAYMFAGNTLNAVQLGLSLFHLGFVSMDSMVSQVALGLEQLVAGKVPAAATNLATHWTAPFTTFLTGNKVIREYLRPGSVGGDFGAIADAVTQGGGRIRMDRFYKNNAIESFINAARNGRVGKAALHILPAAMELAAKPLMEIFVPRMKLGVFAQLARFALDRLPPDATLEQKRAALALVWDSIDNRMGQLVYDNLFWNKAIKDLGMASVRALGWNLGSARELGGGLYDLLHRRFTHRGAYVIALPIVVGLLGAVIMYLFTGRGPETTQDYFEPRTGTKDRDGNEERMQLPSYMKDVLAFKRHPVQTVGHKLHPLLSYIADMLGNADYWGDEIRNPHDPLVVQLRQVADYTATQFTPIGFRNVAEQRRRLESGPRTLLPFIGVTPASREAVRSKAQQLMHEYAQEGRTYGTTPQDAARRELRYQIAEDYHAQKLTYTDARRRLMAEGFTPAQVDDALRRMLENPSVTRFKSLTLAQAEKVYAVGTAAERALWGPVLIRKRLSAGGGRQPGAPRPPTQGRPQRR